MGMNLLKRGRGLVVEGSFKAPEGLPSKHAHRAAIHTLHTLIE